MRKTSGSEVPQVYEAQVIRSYTVSDLNLAKRIRERFTFALLRTTAEGYKVEVFEE